MVLDVLFPLDVLPLIACIRLLSLALLGVNLVVLPLCPDILSSIPATHESASACIARFFSTLPSNLILSLTAPSTLFLCVHGVQLVQHIALAMYLLIPLLVQWLCLNLGP